MQNLLQGLQAAREIVASGPVVMAEIQRKLLEATTPLERMMILRNVTFRVTRNAPSTNRSRNRGSANFEAYRQLRTKSNYV